jgi:hypothetical protein
LRFFNSEGRFRLHLVLTFPKTEIDSDGTFARVAAADANPNHQLKLTRCPHSFAAILSALPSMSLIPFAPFTAESSPQNRLILLPSYFLLGFGSQRLTRWK